MKIAIIARSTVLHFTSGGMETHLKNLAEGLRQSGHNVEIITTSLPYPDKIQTNDEIKIIDYVRYHFLGNTTPGLNPLSPIGKILFFLKQIKRSSEFEGKYNFYDKSYTYFKELNKEMHFDLVISQSSATQRFVDYDGVKSIGILHGTIQTEIQNRIRANKTFKNWVRFIISDYPDWLYEKHFISKKYYGRLDQIVAVSERLKNHFLTDYPNCKNKTVVIYNGIDQTKFLYQKKNYPREMLSLVYVGRVDREKGVDVLLRIMPLLIEKKVKARLVIVGDGIHLQEMQRLTQELKVSNIVDFVGAKTNEEVISYYQGADLFIFPSKRVEGHPMTISEANCTGLPVIATAIGGLKELIANGVNGYTIDEADPKKFAQIIEHLYKNQNEIAQMSQESHEIGILKYSRTAMTKQYLDMMHLLLEN